MADTSVYYRSDLPQGQNIAPRLGTPGTPDFFASILDFVRATAPDVPLDPVIFQAIVLCVMAGNKHVLLRPREEDITVVQNLAALVSNSVFVSTIRPTLFPSSRGVLTIPPPPRYLPTYLVMQPTNTGYLLRRVVSHHRLLSRPFSPYLIKEQQQARWTLLQRCAQSARIPIQPLKITDDTDGKAAS